MYLFFKWNMATLSHKQNRPLALRPQSKPTFRSAWWQTRRMCLVKQALVSRPSCHQNGMKVFFFTCNQPKLMWPLSSFFSQAKIILDRNSVNWSQFCFNKLIVITGSAKLSHCYRYHPYEMGDIRSHCETLLLIQLWDIEYLLQINKSIQYRGF